MNIYSFYISALVVLCCAAACSSPADIDTPRDKNFTEVELAIVAAEFLSKDVSEPYTDNLAEKVRLVFVEGELFISIAEDAICTVPAAFQPTTTLQELTMRMEQRALPAGSLIFDQPMISGTGARIGVNLGAAATDVFDTDGVDNSIRAEFTYLENERNIEIDLLIQITAQPAFGPPIPIDLEATISLTHEELPE